MSKNNYNNNVFINCPYDPGYKPLFRAIVFTILDCGFIPRCSLEVDDATELRLKSLREIISNSRYGVHDLSRLKPDTKTGFPRFNMPFELGLYFGAKHFGDDRQKRKKCIILEKTKFQYRKYISDLSGVEVAAHGNTIKKTVFHVRNWLETSSRRKYIAPATEISSRFIKFQREIKKICKRKGYDYDEMSFLELVKNMTDWLLLNQYIHEPLFH